MKHLVFFLATAVMCCCVFGVQPPAAAESAPPPDTITEQEFKTAAEDLEAVYQRHLGRPPDPGAQRYYTDKIVHERWDIYLVEQDLLTSREYTILNATKACAPASGRGMVTLKAGLPLRDGPGIEHGCVKKMSNGAVITILEDMDGWYKVTYRESEGWVYGKRLTPLEEILGAGSEPAYQALPMETEDSVGTQSASEPVYEAMGTDDSGGAQTDYVPVYGITLEEVEEDRGVAQSESEPVYGVSQTASAEPEPEGESPSSTDTAGREASAAVQWGRDQLNAFTATDTNSNTGKSILMDPAAWDYWSQAFASAAYGRAVPELEAPSPIQSYRELMKAGAIISAGPLPPVGAVVFFDTNETFPRGHVALSAGKPASSAETVIISSGWEGKSGVFELPLHELQQQCGQYLGYSLIPYSTGSLDIRTAAGRSEPHTVLELKFGPAPREVGAERPGKELQGFVGPAAFTLDREGNIYVLDTPRFQVKVFEPGGTLSRIIEYPSQTGEGKPVVCLDILVSPAGNLYLANASEGIIWEISPGGDITRTLGRQENGKGLFGLPTRIELDTSGNFHVYDRSTLRITRLLPSGAADRQIPQDCHPCITGDGSHILLTEKSGVTKFNLQVMEPDCETVKYLAIIVLEDEVRDIYPIGVDSENNVYLMTVFGEAWKQPVNRTVLVIDDVGNITREISIPEFTGISMNRYFSVTHDGKILKAETDEENFRIIEYR